MVICCKMRLDQTRNLAHRYMLDTYENDNLADKGKVHVMDMYTWHSTILTHPDRNQYRFEEALLRYSELTYQILRIERRIIIY